MVIREFGRENPRHLLYFQGSCEPWTEFRESAELLGERFHVMLVTPDGHDPAEHTDFISVEKTVDDAVTWLKARGIDHLDAVYGLSFGGGMAIHMLALDKLDVAIPAQYMKTAEAIMRHGEDNVPEYMIYLQTGDFANCPKAFLMYGADERLYAVAPSIEAALKRGHVDYEMIAGEGMFHCYPVFPIVKEAKEGWRQMINILAGDWKQAIDLVFDKLKMPPG